MTIILRHLLLLRLLRRQTSPFRDPRGRSRYKKKVSVTKLLRENKEHECNFSDYQKAAEKKEEVRKEREEQTKVRLQERHDTRKK